jgi:hypothetical protein
VAWFQSGGLFPPFPVFGGNAGVYLGALFEWLKMFVEFAAPIAGAAMLTYNMILEKVLKLIGGSIGLRLEPKG